MGSLERCPSLAVHPPGGGHGEDEVRRAVVPHVVQEIGRPGLEIRGRTVGRPGPTLGRAIGEDSDEGDGLAARSLPPGPVVLGTMPPTTARTPMAAAAAANLIGVVMVFNLP